MPCLSGYEDARRTSRDGGALLDGNRTNKSLHAVLNVVYALNANEIHVPYRESKLTHIFKESLGGASHVVMLTCLVWALVIITTIFPLLSFLSHF